MSSRDGPPSPGGINGGCRPQRMSAMGSRTKRRRGNMKTNDVYDTSKISCPETDREFWLALLRVKNHYITEAAYSHMQLTRKTGRSDSNHIWFTWLELKSWLDIACHDMFFKD
jgi:hypothetical protein